MGRPIVETSHGKVEGVTEEGRHVFRGIPFAAPPIGDLRFRAPQPPSSWTSLRDASRFGHAAPQVGWAGIPTAVTDTSEDCLTLNVYTPAISGSLPVLVWIHGGGLMVGTGSLDLYDGATITKRDDVVVVTINYRLGLLGGFIRLVDLCGPDLPYTHNCGLLDQVAALTWVRENIDSFGGDAGNVTICGISGGGLSVGTLMAMRAARGLFHRAVSASGPVTIGHHRSALATRAAEDLLGALQIDPKHLGDHLTDLPLDRLLEAESAYTLGQVAYRDTSRHVDVLGPDESTMIINFGPVLDGDVLPTSPLEALMAGAAADIPTIVGTTRDEARPFLLGDPAALSMDAVGLEKRVAWRPWARDGRGRHVIDAYRSARAGRLGVEPFDLLAAIDSDEMMRIGTLRMAEAQTAALAPTFVYLFTWESPIPVLGAAHGLDESFVLGTFDYPPLAALTRGTEEELNLSTAIQDAWVGFCHTGTPETVELRWPVYDVDERPTMVLGATCAVESDPLGVERQTWDGLIRI